LGLQKEAQNRVDFGLSEIIIVELMLLDFPQLVKTFLSALPNDDFPVLDTRLFFSCWLALVMDKSTLSMQDLFKRLNHTGISVDISTFSKASPIQK
jgi:hypothetical protein